MPDFPEYLPTPCAGTSTGTVALTTTSGAGPGPYRACPSAAPREACPLNRGERRASGVPRRRPSALR